MIIALFVLAIPIYSWSCVQVLGITGYRRAYELYGDRPLLVVWSAWLRTLAGLSSGVVCHWVCRVARGVRRAGARSAVAHERPLTRV